jgi:hypothetical protein
MNFKNLLFGVVYAALLAGCQSASMEPPKQNITFIDTTKFDQEMSNSLSSNEMDINVNFYNVVTPNQIPPRMEKWLSEVDSTGGKVTIAQPVGELAPKDPLILFGLFSSLWNYFKTASGISDMVNSKNSTKNRNAVIQLARNQQGEIYIEKISFPARVNP